MNIHLPAQSKQSLGGGWTFRRTFEKYALRAGVGITAADQADVILISGATMVSHEDVAKWKSEGKKIVLRVDNIPRNSRNRNTGTSRLHAFAGMADLVVYQSQWAKQYIGPFLSDVDKSHGPVILNGADPEIFYPGGPKAAKKGSPQYMFCQFNRDETKQWHVAWYDYIMAQRQNPNAHLRLVGQFSPEHIEYNFDFFGGEKFEYVGVVETPEAMADLMRATDILLLPYFNDACSNTLIEARLCGVPQIVHNGTGGTAEIMAASLDRLRADWMVREYLEEMGRI